MFYETAKSDHGLPLDPFKALIVPRPIAWISTISAAGEANLAPYSFFNAFAEHPHYMAFGSKGVKHTLANIHATGEFAINMPTFALREAMSASSTSALGDEFEMAELEKAPCTLIKVPRVAASPVTFECRHFRTVDLPDDPGITRDYLVIGRVIGIHIADGFVEEGRVNTAKFHAIARLGYAEYATVSDVWRMRRPG